jgi:hypothetical protein
MDSVTDGPGWIAKISHDGHHVDPDRESLCLASVVSLFVIGLLESISGFPARLYGFRESIG